MEVYFLQLRETYEGATGKCKYNDQIRRNQGRNSLGHPNKSHLGLLDFEHPEPQNLNLEYSI